MWREGKKIVVPKSPDEFISLVLYICLAILVIVYLYILLCNRSKSSFFWGRRKKVQKILFEYPNVTSRATNKIKEIEKRLEQYFYKNGDVDYEKLLDTLVKVKSECDMKQYKSICDILIKNIQNEHHYLHVSNASSEIFSQLECSIRNKNFEEALEDLKLLYKKNIEIESAWNRRGKVEFWIGIIGAVIGLLGLVIPFLQFIQG